MFRPWWLLVVLWLLPPLAHAQAVLPGLDEPRDEAWRALGGVWVTSAVTLDKGMTVGLGGEVRRRLSDGPYFVGARLGWSSADDSTASWQLQHDLGLVALTGGIEKTTQVARFAASLSAGGMLLRGAATRHQAKRLEGLGITDLTRVGWSAGPWTSIDLSLALQVRAGFCILISAGPFAAFPATDGSSLSTRFGVQSTLGVFRAL